MSFGRARHREGGGGSVLKSKRFTARFLAVNRLTTVNRLRYRLTAKSKEVHLLSNTVNRLKKQFSSSCTQIAVHWLIYRAEPFVRLKRDVSRLTALFYLGLPTYVRGQLPRYKIAKIFRLWRRSQLIKTVNWSNWSDLPFLRHGVVERTERAHYLAMYFGMMLLVDESLQLLNVFYSCLRVINARVERCLP